MKNNQPLMISTSCRKLVSFVFILPFLGDGAYSNVFKVKRYEDSLCYALKKVKLDHLSEKERENAINEVRILASIKHPNVIQYKDAFLDENSKSLW
jgi:NIMA (never in mitosis gene a)-related kinase